jgi:hypothetical protein
MFQITWDPSSRSDKLYLIEITYMVQLCLLCAWSVFGGIFWTCGVCACTLRRAENYCRQ